MMGTPARRGDGKPARCGQACAGRAHRDDLLAGELDRDEIVAARGEHDEPELAAPVGHTRFDAGRVLGLGNAHDHARMRDPEPPHQARERIDGERRQRYDVEGSSVERADGADRVEHERALAHEPPGRSLEGTAGVRERDAAAHPVEQADAELGLEPADTFRERRLCHVQAVGAGREAAVVDDSEHVVDLPQLHRVSLCYL